MAGQNKWHTYDEMTLSEVRHVPSDLNCYFRDHRWQWQKQGGHATGKTGNLVINFSRQGKHREFSSNTGKIVATQGKFWVLPNYAFKIYPGSSTVTFKLIKDYILDISCS